MITVVISHSSIDVSSFIATLIKKPKQSHLISGLEKTYSFLEKKF